MKVIFWRVVISYAVVWVALMGMSHFIYEHNPALGMKVWNAGQSLLCLPWVILGKALAAFIGMFSDTPDIIDATGSNYAINNIFGFLLMIGLVILLWKKVFKPAWNSLVGGGAKSAHH